MRTRATLARRARPVIRDLFEKEITVDCFAGGGGHAIGSKAAGSPVDIAINHDPVAIAVFQDNNPETECYRADIFSVDPVKACRGRHVRHLHASPDCRHHSRAKGGAPVSESVRALADVVPIWGKAVRPDVITIENVPEFIDWGPLYAVDTWKRGAELRTAPLCPSCGWKPNRKKKVPAPKKHRGCAWRDVSGKPIPERRGEFFKAWHAKLAALGYVIEHRVLYAHHYGAPTSRKRFYLVARCDGQPIVWPAPTHGPGLRPYRTAAECVDWSIPTPSIFDRKRPLAKATLRRVAAGFVKFVLNNPRPYIIKVNHSDKDGRTRGAESIDQPLTTVTAERRGHALVAPTLVQTSYGERKGQRPRWLDLHKPLTTIVAGGQKHALVESLLAPFVSQFNLGQVGHTLKKPLPTITSIDHHALAGVKLAPEQIADQYPNATKVLPFLISYYGSEADIGQALGAPLRTITTRDRFALVGVVVDGLTYVIVDITLRMLEPHELLKAQFGKYAKGYRLGKALTKKDRMRLIGNSVVPLVMEAIIRANLGGNRTHPQQRRAA